MLRLPKYSGSGIVLGWVEQILAYYYIYYLPKTKKFGCVGGET